MKTDTALKYFKSRAALAKAAGVSKQAVQRWVKTGVVPEAAAYRLQARERGRLKVIGKLYQAAGGNGNADLDQASGRNRDDRG